MYARRLQQQHFSLTHSENQNCSSSGSGILLDHQEQNLLEDHGIDGVKIGRKTGSLVSFVYLITSHIGDTTWPWPGQSSNRYIQF
jgi:hypothetical protein